MKFVMEAVKGGAARPCNLQCTAQDGMIAYSEKWLEGKKFVYYPYYYHGNNCYMDCLYVYWKDIESE